MCELGRLKTRDRLRSPVVAFKALAATITIAVAIAATEVAATAAAATEVAATAAAATEAATATAAAATEAATTAAAAAEAATTAAAATTKSAARWTRSAGLSFIHHESAAFEILAIQSFDRCSASFFRAHGHEAEAT
jgi:hypothetical protein